MTQKTVTLTIPEPLYEGSQRLVDQGLFTNFDEIIRAGLRHILLESAWLAQDHGADLFRLYLHNLRDEIAQQGGLFPEQTAETVLTQLRQTREDLYGQKYAAYFGHE